MNKEEFIKELEKLNVEVSNEKLNKLEDYLNFLLEYNTHTNLTAIKNKEEIYLKHFYDSLTICRVYDLSKVNNLIDIGTGAGFPGMIIKIFFPNISVTLLDSNNKKTKFLSELSKKLNIKVEIINDRVEIYSKNNLNKFDIVTSRAVANLRVLSELALPLVKEKGYFIALKANIDKEINDALETIDILNSKIIKKEEFYLYNNIGFRTILVIEKHNKTDIKILRSYDKILKKPLKKIFK